MRTITRSGAVQLQRAQALKKSEPTLGRFEARIANRFLITG